MQQDENPLSVNRKLADLLEKISLYYQEVGDVHRTNAFNNASLSIANYPEIIFSGTQARQEIQGIGVSIEHDIDEYLSNKIIAQADIDKYITSGNHSQSEINDYTNIRKAAITVNRLEELKAKRIKLGKNEDFDRIVSYFQSFYGIGPKKAVNFYNMGFRTVEDLWFKGNLTHAQQLGIIWIEHIKLRIPRDEMIIINRTIASYLDRYGIEWVMAGSFRRQESSSSDIDLLIKSRDDFNLAGISQILQPIIPAILSEGLVELSGILRISDEYNGHRIDIKITRPESFIFALFHFTGSWKFNELIRRRAKDLGFILNEKSLSNRITGAVVGNIYTEEDIFNFLRVKYVLPEDRSKTINKLEFF